MKGFAKKSPNTTNRSEENSIRKNPLLAASSASAKRFAPSLREISELMPTPVPTATDIISIKIG